jgi:ankyrin repeat protein/globin
MAEMDPESVFPASTADSQGVDLYQALGGMDTCRRLSAAFYAHVEHDPVLRPLYPPTLKGCPIETLAAFLIQFFGGAAFLSFLAILSSSSQPALLDYVRQTLVTIPKLVQERYTYGRTLLHEVAGQRNLPLVELLLHLGADPNARDQWEHTPLYFVGNASHGAYGAAVVRILIQNGANVNAQERLKHCTALHMAARRGNVPVAEALLDCGADAEARDKLGDTPLHRAVKCGKTEMVAFLLSRGANVHAEGKRGLTPWQVARGASMRQLLQSSHE